MMRRGFTIVCMMMILMFSTGCPSNKPGQYNLQVALGGDLGRSGQWDTVLVDVVAVDETEKAAWDQKNANAYFAPNNIERAEVSDRTLKLTLKNNGVTVERPGASPEVMAAAGSAPSITIDKKDPIWAKWGSRPWLVFLAKVPETQGLVKSIPRHRSSWESPGLIRMTVKRTAIEVTPPFLPPQ